jgi:hypothetical protein
LKLSLILIVRRDIKVGTLNYASLGDFGRSMNTNDLQLTKLKLTNKICFRRLRVILEFNS